MTTRPAMTPWGTVGLTAFLGFGTLFLSVPFGFLSLYMLNDSVTWTENLTFAVIVLVPALVVGLACGLASRKTSGVLACLQAAPAVPLLLSPIWAFTIMPFNEWGYATPETDLRNALLSAWLVTTGAVGLWAAHRLLAREAAADAETVA